MKYSLWVGGEVVLESDSVERLKIEIDWYYEDYDDVVIADNETNEAITT